MDYIKGLRRLVGHRPLILTSVMVLVCDPEGRLLQKRAGTGAWHVPGGDLEPGERLTDAARRELREETGLEPDGFELLGAFSGPEFHWTYPNGDEAYNVTVAYGTRDVSGQPEADGAEGTEVAFFPLNRLPETLGSSASPVLADLSQRGLLTSPTAQSLP